MGLYSLCGALQAVLVSVWLMLARYLCELPTSYNLHSHLVKGTLGSPMYFFDNTQIGQILNRFTKDLLRIVSALYGAWLGILNSSVRILTAILVLVGASPIFATVHGTITSHLLARTKSIHECLLTTQTSGYQHAQCALRQPPRNPNRRLDNPNLLLRGHISN